MFNSGSFERPQYSDIRAHWTSKEGELAGKGPCDTYGAEHLCRLLGTLPRRAVSPTARPFPPFPLAFSDQS